MLAALASFFCGDDLLDVGLLVAMAGLGPELLIQGEQVFHEFCGAFTENYAAQQLRVALG